MANQKPRKRRGRPLKVAADLIADLPVETDPEDRSARLVNVTPRVLRRLEVLDLAESAAAKMAGLEQSVIRNWRRTLAAGGPDLDKRTVHMRSVELLAPVLKTTPEWLAWGLGPEDADEAAIEGPPINLMPVLGEIAAGNLLDISIHPPDVPIDAIPAPISERFPRVRHYALRVRGDSVNEIYPDGTYVICVDFADSGLRLTNGQLAHVEILRFGGQVYEITLKEVRMDADGVVTLHPRSTNPAYKPLRLADMGDDIEARIRGIVVSGITPAPVV